MTTNSERKINYLVHFYLFLEGEEVLSENCKEETVCLNNQCSTAYISSFL